MMIDINPVTFFFLGLFLLAGLTVLSWLKGGSDE